MPLTKPLNNMCLIEVVKDYEGVSRLEDNESLSSGILLDFAVSDYHLTAASAIRFDESYKASNVVDLTKMKGQTVRWEQYAEGGQTFEEDGKTYALVPWWRLISVVGES